MQIVLLRIGIDTGSGGIHGPLFKNGSFEFVPIPDQFGGTGVNSRTYGNTRGRHKRMLIDYFPESRQQKNRNKSVHNDPEFDTFTYGDPTSPKAGLRRLAKGDLIVFYCGLEGWDFKREPRLYFMGYFNVLWAGLATELRPGKLQELFAQNFHVGHKKIFEDQKQRLVLVKGGKGSRLLKNAVQMSSVGKDKNGKPLKVLSPGMRRIFGDFHGKISVQRSPPRWVQADFVERAAKFVKSLK